MRRFLTEEQRQRILAEYADPTASPIKIAEAHGVYRNYVTDLARRRGVKSPRTVTRSSREERLWQRAKQMGPVVA